MGFSLSVFWFFQIFYLLQFIHEKCCPFLSYQRLRYEKNTAYVNKMPKIPNTVEKQIKTKNKKRAKDRKTKRKFYDMYYALQMSTHIKFENRTATNHFVIIHFVYRIKEAAFMYTSL